MTGSSSSSHNNHGDSVILATAGYDHTIKFWQPHTGICHKTVPHPDSQVNALEITPDRQFIAAAGYQHIRLYDINSNNLNAVIKYEDMSKNVTSVGFNLDGKFMYTSGEDCCARMWDLRARNLACQRIFKARAPVNCVCLHPNQTELFVGDQSGAIYIWDLKSEKNEQYVPDNNSSIQSISIDPEGTHMAAVTDKGTCFIWNLTGGRTAGELTKPHAKKQLDAHNRYALKCLFSPDSTLLATTSADTTLRIWKTIDFSQMCELSLPDQTQKWVWDCAFSEDSQYILSASSDHCARLWNIESGKVEKEYTGHTKAVTCLAFVDG